jgi:hypothetical protein
VSAPAQKPVYREMTVASVREQTGAEPVKVAFLEAARFYKLSRDHPGFERILERLRGAEASQRVLRVRLASLDSDVIEDVEL